MSVQPINDDVVVRREIPDDDVAAPNPDSNAGKEQAAIFEDDYAEDGRRQTHKREQGIKNIAYYATAALVWGGIVLIVGLSGVWAAHMLLPSNWRWLTPAEIDHIQALLFSGSLSAACRLGPSPHGATLSSCRSCPGICRLIPENPAISLGTLLPNTEFLQC